MPSPTKIRVGTRGSQLAQWQSHFVASCLREFGVEIEVITISTHGDRQSADPVESLGGTGVFTKEIQRALLDNQIDLAVHSLKDLPTEPVEGLVLAAVPPRERCGDVLVSRGPHTIDDLPTGSVVGTGSFRRQAQLKHWRSDLKVCEIRGNVETRLGKLESGEFDAVILAEAGLIRLGFEERFSQQILPKERFLPAVGQGALGLETRADDQHARAAVAELDDPETHMAVTAERVMLARLRGGCLAPVGAWARQADEENLRLSTVVLNRSGTQRIETHVTGANTDARALGQQAANELIERGADDLIQSSRAGD